MRSEIIWWKKGAMPEGRPRRPSRDHETIFFFVKDPGQYQVTSPPAIIKDLVVVGSSIGDNRRYDSEAGTVRAFDARNGKMIWAWDPIPTDKPAGAANAWSVISVDIARNLLFVPTGSASPDFYGARRPGANPNSNSVVALDAPGCGASSDPPESFRLPEYADALAALVDELALRRVNVLGHS